METNEKILPKKSSKHAKKSSSSATFILSRTILMEYKKKFRTWGCQSNMNVKNNLLWMPYNSKSNLPCPSPDLCQLSGVALEESDCWKNYEIPTIEIVKYDLFFVLNWIKVNEQRFKQNEIYFGNSIQYCLRLLNWMLENSANQKIFPNIIEEVRKSLIQYNLLLGVFRGNEFRELLNDMPGSLYRMAVPNFKAANIEEETRTRSAQMENFTHLFSIFITRLILPQFDNKFFKIPKRFLNGLTYEEESIISAWFINLITARIQSNSSLNNYSPLLIQRYVWTNSERENDFRGSLEKVRSWTNSPIICVNEESYRIGFIIQDTPCNESGQLELPSKKSQKNGEVKPKWSMEAVICNFGETFLQPPSRIFHWNQLPKELKNPSNLSAFILQLYTICFGYGPLNQFFLQEYPSSISLSQSELIHFLEKTRPLLEVKGIYVQPPSWWQNESQEIQLIMNLNSPGSDTGLFSDYNSYLSTWNFSSFF